MLTEFVHTCELSWPTDPENATWEQFRQLSDGFSEPQISWFIDYASAKIEERRIPESPPNLSDFADKLSKLSKDSIEVLFSTLPGYCPPLKDRTYPPELLSMICDDVTLDLTSNSLAIRRRALRTHPQQRIEKALDHYLAADSLRALIHLECDDQRKRSQLEAVYKDTLEHLLVYCSLCKPPEENQNGV